MHHATLFLSYSREQFYYAESVALTLPSLKIEVWFDVQRLTPGSRWRTGIEAGLHECDGLILIASRAALASPYVEREWVTVLSAGKPVYILLFEAVHLPEALHTHAAAIIDGRRDFDTAVRRIAEAMILGTGSHDDVPAPLPFDFPAVVPRPVATMAMFLLTNTVWLALAGGLLYLWLTNSTTTLRPSDLYPVWFLLLMSVVSGITTWRFLIRQIGYRTLALLRNIILFVHLFVLVTAAIALLGQIFFADNENRSLANILVILSVSAVSIGIEVLGSRVSNHDLKTGDFLRWMPRGVATSQQRHLINRAITAPLPRRNTRTVPVSEATRRYFHIEHTPQQQGAAQLISREMLRAGHLLVAPEEADLTLLIVTRTTHPAEVADLLARGHEIIPVILGGIDVRHFGDLLERQVIDPGTRDIGVLRAFAAQLAGRAAGDIAYGLAVTPRRLNQRVPFLSGKRLVFWWEIMPENGRRLTVRGIKTAGLLLISGVIMWSIHGSLTNPDAPVIRSTPIPTHTLSEQMATSSTQTDALQNLLSKNIRTSGTFGDVSFALAGVWESAEAVGWENPITTQIAPLYDALAEPVLIFNAKDAGLLSGGQLRSMVIIRVNASSRAEVSSLGWQRIPVTASAGTGVSVEPVAQVRHDTLTTNWIFHVTTAEAAYDLHFTTSRIASATRSFADMLATPDLTQISLPDVIVMLLASLTVSSPQD